MLRASDLHSGYDGVTVIKGVSLEVENEIFAVLGYKQYISRLFRVIFLSVRVQDTKKVCRNIKQNIYSQTFMFALTVRIVFRRFIVLEGPA